MKKKIKRTKFVFRLAVPSDVDGLIELEKDVWKENAANREQLSSRIRTFPEGNIIAIFEDRIVGYLSFEYVCNLSDFGKFSWASVTDNGMIANSHQSQGEYMYGINLAIHRSMSGQNLGLGLTLQAWINMILNNKRGVFMGSRIPGFKNYKDLNPDISAEEYIKLRRNGHLRDYELRLYAKDGLLAVKVLPDYFPDPASLDYGVLLYRKNPFYGWPLRKLWAWMISKVPISFRESIATKKRLEVRDV